MHCRYRPSHIVVDLKNSLVAFPALVILNYTARALLIKAYLIRAKQVYEDGDIRQVDEPVRLIEAEPRQHVAGCRIPEGRVPYQTN